MSQQLKQVIQNVQLVYEKLKNEDQNQYQIQLILDSALLGASSKLICNTFFQLLLKIEKNNEDGIQICNILQFTSDLSKKIIEIFESKYLDLIELAELDKHQQIPFIFKRICQFITMQNDNLFNIILSMIIQNNDILQKNIQSWDLQLILSIFEEETLVDLIINDQSLLDIFKKINFQPNQLSKLSKILKQ
ncbi:hypothetical protein ABPG73_013242 [Tetrahymena malaccensis]